MRGSVSSRMEKSRIYEEMVNGNKGVMVGCINKVEGRRSCRMDHI